MRQACDVAAGPRQAVDQLRSNRIGHDDEHDRYRRGCALENLYATWGHEHIHWTGHKDRLNRELVSRFKEAAYAFEELVAEFGAAMACAHLGVTGELRHASYVEHWLKVLRTITRRYSPLRVLHPTQRSTCEGSV